ncbi:MAG: sigma-54-dependent Fis family transcriptional regulator [Aquabacterium sp.]|uniref:sigma-54-dependent Fis family transcriptional regulator n=1 Tax=Aquabacterium sp. TaxID=1872578 RepID=UPI002720C1F9|nr:sigma-54-dependent Fis family transcriptional regulator [Aquabacterium sp.]MDO9006413.1 sigma-54-dependent Fis family transcriptional regulator [Aquabacterium sp.]
MTPAHSPSASALSQARRSLAESGEVPHGLVNDALLRSWLRCQRAGLSPVDHYNEPPLSGVQELKVALACEHDFLAHARPVMDFVAEQVRGSGSLVVLSDVRGLLLHSLGDLDFVSRADRVSLRPGALWLEADRGTNAIGTALAERRAVVIHGAEHYLERNSFLTCAAAPVRAPNGQLKGVLDISGDHRGQHPHTFALVRSAARMIEDRLFHARHHRDLIVRLHPQAEGLGGIGEGLVALSTDGWIVGVNSQAQQWLDLDDALIGACTLEQATGTRLGLWPPSKVMQLRLPAVGMLHARLDSHRQETVTLRYRAETASPIAPVSAQTIPSRPAAQAIPDLEHALDPRVNQALQRARRVQAQGISVLIQGESGTGKEVFARHLHTEGPRSHKPFVAVNCAALPEALIEAELFGYVGGAFTGARREGSPGRIREADGGTLFLDEIGDMPLPLQARLLRVLQDKVIVPLGGSKPVPVDFVLVSATHRQLKEAIAEGHFREDLYYRLNGLSIALPSLRDRQDFKALVSEVLTQITQDMGRPQVERIHPGLMQALAHHPWPGNIRQLYSLLRTACALLDPDAHALDWSHLPDDMVEELQHPPQNTALTGQAPPARHGSLAELGTPPVPGPLTLAEPNLRKLSAQTIRQVIAASEGNLSLAARQLGISRNTLYRKLKQIQA